MVSTGIQRAGKAPKLGGGNVGGHMRWSLFRTSIPEPTGDDNATAAVHRELRGARGRCPRGPHRAGDRGGTRFIRTMRQEDVFAGGRASRDSEHEATIRDLHAKIGELTVERDLCAACNGEPRRTPGAGRAGRPSSSIRRQCALLGINRSSVTTRRAGRARGELGLVRRMDELSLQYPFYGHAGRWRAT